MNKDYLSRNLTILVNSCDGYSDLWHPFFKLYKKYLNIPGVRIVLNTESKKFKYEGLPIDTVNCSDKNYGARIINAIKSIKTKYVLTLLDDFFLRSPSDINKIKELITYMEKNNRIACINFEKTKTDDLIIYENCTDLKILPKGTNYTINMQAAIWQTKKLLKLWRPYVSPWEWELYCNYKTFYNKKDIFLARNTDSLILDYGHYNYGDIWGVYRGKWVIEDVAPLFSKENIDVNYNSLGIYNKSEKQIISTPSRFDFKEIYRLLGLSGVLRYFVFKCQLYIKRHINKNYDCDFFTYLKESIKVTVDSNANLRR